MVVSVLLLLILVHLTSNPLPMNGQQRVMLNVILMVLGIVFFFVLGGYVGRL